MERVSLSSEIHYSLGTSLPWSASGIYDTIFEMDLGDDVAVLDLLA